MRRRRPKPAQLDEEFQEEIIDHHRAGDGEEVAEKLRPGDVLVVLEAMKMEIEVSAPVDGTVKSVAVNVGATVNTDDLLVTLG